MAINYPGPFEVRIQYTANPASGAKQHEVRFSTTLTTDFNAGDDINGAIANQRDGGTANLVTWVDGLAAVLAAVFSNTADINTAELWEYAPGTFNADWRATWALTVPGTSGSATQEDAQAIWSFRTLAGGVAKLDLRNTIFAEAVTASYLTGNAGIDNIFDYLSDPDTIVVGRDGGFLVQGLHFLAGRNEKMFKRRLRP